MAVSDFPRRTGSSGDSILDSWLDILADRIPIDLQIELTAVADGDELGIFDVSANAFRKITKLNLVGADPTIPAAATQAEQETGTSLTTYVSPGRQHFSKGAPKCVMMATVAAGVPTLQTPPSYNITSIGDTAIGRLTVTIATDFSSTVWACIPGIEAAATSALAFMCSVDAGSRAEGSVILECLSTDDAGAVAFADPTSWSMAGFGDQA